MRLKFLGTGAAEGWPALFCSCDACREARVTGGKNIRTRASLLLGEEVLVDFPPDVYHHFLTHNLDYKKLRYLLVTHGHRDHFAPGELKWRKEPFITPGGRGLTLGGDRYVLDLLRESVGDPGECNIRAVEFQAFVEQKLGTLTVLPLPAHHYPEKGAFIYVLTWEDKNILVGYDSGWFARPVWERLGEKPLDCVILECTGGPGSSGEYHMGFAEMLMTRDKLSKMGVLGPATFCLATHFSHTGKLLHHCLEELLAREGIIAAYDGLELFV